MSPIMTNVVNILTRKNTAELKLVPGRRTVAARCTTDITPTCTVYDSTAAIIYEEELCQLSLATTSGIKGLTHCYKTDFGWFCITLDVMSSLPVGEWVEKKLTSSSSSVDRSSSSSTSTLTEKFSVSLLLRLRCCVNKTSTVRVGKSR